MKKTIISKFQHLQRTKNDLLQSLSHLSEEELQRPAEGGKWSVAQILFHLYISEKLSLQYMQKKSQELNQLKPAGLKERFKSILLGISLRLPIKYQAPRRLAEQMPAEIDWQNLLIEWGQTRDALYKFIDQLPEESLRLKLFKHPRIGYINILQTMTFFQSHFDHHLPQVNNHLSKFDSDQ
ncbi:MAG: DinB family protein [Fulvivirga sp.]|nr:DinB family protein [Fulvivirga sp.]